MKELFQTIFYQPLLNLLIFIALIFPGHDLGAAIILLTLLVKLLLAPLSWKQIQAQIALQEVQPEMERLKEVHKNDKQALAQAQMELFKEKKINPLSSCLPLLIQLPFLFALYYVFIDGVGSAEKIIPLLYSFVAYPEGINTVFLGMLSLTTAHNIPLAILVAAVQYLQTRLLMPPQKKQDGEKKTEPDMASIMNKQMLYFVPILTGVMSYQFPSALGLYWFTQTALGILQQLLFLRMKKKA